MSLRPSEMLLKFTHNLAWISAMECHSVHKKCHKVTHNLARISAVECHSVPQKCSTVTHNFVRISASGMSLRPPEMSSYPQLSPNLRSGKPASKYQNYGTALQVRVVSLTGNIVCKFRPCFMAVEGVALAVIQVYRESGSKCSVRSTPINKYFII